MMQVGYCQCGCGNKTTIHERNRPCDGIIKGTPREYLLGHGMKGKRGANWNGGRQVDALGYVRVLKRNHPRADQNGYVKEHILIAERSYGGHLPEGASIHHVNENRSDNLPGNLVICQDESYHHLLHDRMRSMRECGHASWRKCWICGVYDDPVNMNAQGLHRLCFNSYNRKQHAKRKDAGNVRHYRSYKRSESQANNGPSSARLPSV